MDSIAQSEGFLIDIIDNDWRLDTLPNDHIAIPLDKIPDLETDTDQTSLKEQEEKWLDLALNNIAPELATSDLHTSSS